MRAIFDHGPKPPCPARFDLVAYVLKRAETHASKTALSVIGPDGAEHWTYGRFEAAVLGTARGLISEGLRPGDRLLMRLGNSVEFPICYLAALAADIIPVPTSSLLTEPEVSGIAEDIAPRLIVAEDGLALPPRPPCPDLPADAGLVWADRARPLAACRGVGNRSDPLALQAGLRARNDPSCEGDIVRGRHIIKSLPSVLVWARHPETA